MRSPVRFAFDSYAGPMPREVVPMFAPPSAFSRAPSRRACVGRMTWARSDRRRLSPTVTPAARSDVDLGEKRARVDDEAVADHVHDARAADARRDEAQREVLVAELHGVAGVVSALVAGDEVERRGDEIDDLALALVAPLAADDGESRAFDVCHFWIVPEEKRDFSVSERGR